MGEGRVKERGGEVRMMGRGDRGGRGRGKVREKGMGEGLLVFLPRSKPWPEGLC